MAEAAGLVLGALGIAGLFKSCVENFDIVVRARECSEKFESLCTILSLQQIRLVIWGETLGLVPGPEGVAVRYNRGLDRADIALAVARSLNQLHSLLSQADVITGRYQSQFDGSTADVEAASQAMTIFREPYERFKARLKKSQKQKSIWMVTRWSIRDYDRFESLIGGIRDLIDALESITNALGKLEEQHRMLVDEIESLSDVQSLEFLQEVGSSQNAPAVLQTVAETASLRLSTVTMSSRSYHTAPTEQSHGSLRGQLRSFPIIPDESARATSKGLMDPDKMESVRESNLKRDEETNQQVHEKQTPQVNSMDVPQHQRWMAELVRRHNPIDQHFSAPKGDVEYGKVLHAIREADEESYCTSSLQLMTQGHEGHVMARQVFLELRNVRRAAVPFISAATVGNDLSRLLASIEGPPGTPYEGGIFWITVKLAQGQPPALMFQTRIYHPNIDCTGRICADYTDWWQQTHLMNMRQEGRTLPWFSERVTNHYSLSALLVALCGLLSSPNINDPLVPEIAEKYLTDFEGYCEAARMYTQKYAKISDRPDENELRFANHNSQSLPETNAYGPPSYTSKAVPASLRNVQSPTPEHTYKENLARLASHHARTAGESRVEAINIIQERREGMQEDDSDNTDVIMSDIKRNERVDQYIRDINSVIIKFKSLPSTVIESGGGAEMLQEEIRKIIRFYERN